MTAVASPPTLQPLPRWHSADEREGLDSITPEEVTRMFMPRKSAQRTNSSSSMTSNVSTPSTSASSTSTAQSSAPQTNGNDTAISNGDQGGWGPRKKATRGLWPSSKAEPVSGLTTARPQVLPTPSSGQSAASTMNNAMHHPSPILPSQSRLQSQPQQNGSRTDQPPNTADPPAILALLPMTGTFERKQIVIPYFPEVLRIGRQTNAKTVPTAVNGYFDSKVLSRQHAEVWAERNGKIWIRDVKSSNGTFVNGNRLSPENRDSDPHELRESDTLELGIDIVSEDQKSIVHHKVSAKVELAGIYPNPPSLLEMELNHNNPNAGNIILGEPMSQQLSQMRGRGGSQGLIGNNGRMSGSSNMGNNLNMMGPSRQVNMWMGPITIEQAMKKLTVSGTRIFSPRYLSNDLQGEFKVAKTDLQDLDRTGDFFDALSNLPPGEELPKSPLKVASEEKQANGILPPPQLDPISPFSQPPAPPPQEPLPEKPDIAPFLSPESPPQPPLKRTETERPRSSLSSPTPAESSQIISLVEALKIKSHELDLKVDYIRSLEIDLAREKKARENAERRVFNLSGVHLGPEDHNNNGAVDEEAFQPPSDTVQLMEQNLSNGHFPDHDDGGKLSRSSSTLTLRNADGAAEPREDVSSLASRLQSQLDLRNKEMNEMKLLMESYRQRTEVAEEGRRTLAEMVENIRAGRDPKSASPNTKDERTISSGGSGEKAASQLEKFDQSRELDDDSPSAQHSYHLQNGSAAIGKIHREVEKTMSTVLQQHQREWGGSGESGRMVQSAPYVSMVGVVLIGVGIMTWLNGWQPGGEK